MEGEPARDVAMDVQRAPVFGSSNGGVDMDPINLDEIFEDCFAQDWQFLGDVPPEENEALLASIDPVPVLPKPRSITANISKGKSLEQMKHEQKMRLRGTKKRYEDDDSEEDDDDEDFVVSKKKRKVNGDSGKQRRRRPTAAAGDLKDLTDQQRVERRERNREHAKRSRIRKKFLLESLLEQVSDLRSENKELRHVIRAQFPEEAHQILNDCSTEESLLLCAEPTHSPIGPTQQLMEPDFRLMMALQSAQQNFAVSDPSLPDNPIVYASKGFLNLTGYSMHQVIGRNCRFLQGPGTDKKAVDVIRKGVENGIDTSVCLLNYKADGTPFWNQFFVAALRDADGQIVNYVGVQCQVNQVPLDEIKERAKRMALIDL